MRKLGDYVNPADISEQDWLSGGDHEFEITGVREGTAHSGSPFSELTCTAKDGSSKLTFVFKPGSEGNLRVFAKFLKFGLGFQDAQVSAFDIDSPQHWQRLAGKRFNGRVVPDRRNPQYHVIGKWWAIGAEAPAPEQYKDNRPPQNTWAEDDKPPQQAPSTGYDAPPPDDDIPF